MKENDFKKFQEKAVNICEDYSTTTPDSETIEMFYFTPRQLKVFAEYCLSLRRNYNTNYLNTESINLLKE